MGNLEEKIKNVIESEINVKLLEHDGWVELVRIEGDVANVRFRGACSSCGSTQDTLDTVLKPSLTAIVGICDVRMISDVSEDLLMFARSLMTHRG